MISIRPNKGNIDGEACSQASSVLLQICLTHLFPIRWKVIYETNINDNQCKRNVMQCTMIMSQSEKYHSVDSCFKCICRHLAKRVGLGHLNEKCLQFKPFASFFPIYYFFTVIFSLFITSLLLFDSLCDNHSSVLRQVFHWICSTATLLLIPTSIKVSTDIYITIPL